MNKSITYNSDCLVAMRKMPDKAYSLAIVDPEFGIDIGNSPRLVLDKGFAGKSWDAKPIDPAYFAELFRVSRNQIIWGGNYYSLPANKHCVIWDKLQPEAMSFGMFDYAWTSFDGANKIFRLSSNDESTERIHPTQKPVKLYRWLLKRYGNEGDTILDTHLGSGSSRIAAKDYFEAQEKRFQIHTSQARLFEPPPVVVPETHSLF